MVVKSSSIHGSDYGLAVIKNVTIPITVSDSHNQHKSSTSKEHDEETGYGYFAARYKDYEMMTMWLSVDQIQ